MKQSDGIKDLNLKKKAKKLLLSLRNVRKENKSKISTVEMKDIIRDLIIKKTPN